MLARRQAFVSSMMTSLMDYDVMLQCTPHLEKYMKSREGIELLGLPEAELKQKVPSASSLANLKDNSVSSHVMIYFVVSSAIM